MSTIKKKIYTNKAAHKVVGPIYGRIKRKRNFTSGSYWEGRYEKGGNSGAGSYGRLAVFKADFLNDFVKKHKINQTIEFGVGDGAQLKLFTFPNYIGFDVSKASIDLCKNIFLKDKTKSFFLYNPDSFIDNHQIFKGELALSLDVIYHLVEDTVFDKYMKDLFSCSAKYVIIYASDTDDNKDNYAQHVKHRKFSKWVAKNQKNWRLEKVVKNKYSIETNEIDESFADFFIYKKIKS